MLLSNHLEKVKSKITKRQILIVASLFLITGVSILLISYYQLCKKEQIEQKKITTFMKNQKEIPNPEFVRNTDVKENQQVSKISDRFIAVLEIPSIKLLKGLYDKNSKQNNVNRNIEILKESTMPDVENGNLILAGHSGSSKISYFNNLKKLKLNSKIYVYFNSYKYEYNIHKIYEENKDGNIIINRDNNKSAITLITCKNHSKDKQIIYIGYLIKKEQVNE